MVGLIFVLDGIQNAWDLVGILPIVGRVLFFWFLVSLLSGVVWALAFGWARSRAASRHRRTAGMPAAASPLRAIARPHVAMRTVPGGVPSHGHFATGGSDIKTASGLCPVSSPNFVPRS